MSKDISSQPGPVNYKEKYPLTFGNKARRPDTDVSQRRQQAWETARATSTKLNETFGATRVVFGS